MTILGNAAGDTKNTSTTDDSAKGSSAGGAAGDDAAKAATAKAAADKEAADLAAKPFADLKQLKVPDGVKTDEPQLKKFLERAQKHGFSAAQAQAMFDLNLESSKEIEAAQKASIDAANQAAITAIKSDKEIGGAKFDVSMKLASRALAKFGGDGLKDALETVQLADGSMLGDSLVMAKLLVRLGASLGEDTIGSSTSNGATKRAATDGPDPKGLYPKTPQLT